MEPVLASSGDREREVRLRAGGAPHPTGPSAASSAIHSSTLSVWGRRSDAIAQRASASSSRSRGDARKLARQHVVEHLATLAEAGLDQAPQPLLRLLVEAAWLRRAHEDGRVDLRSRLERGRRHGEGDAHVRVVLDEHREVAHRARRRRDPLRDLGLDHEDEPRRTRLAAERDVEDGARDVVRDVRDERPRRPPRSRRVPRRGSRPRRAGSAARP